MEMNSRTIASLREQRRATSRSMLNLLGNNPGQSWNPAHQHEYDAALADLDRLDGEIFRAETAQDRDNDSRIDDAIATVRRGRRGRDPVTDKYLRFGETALSRDEILNTMSTTTGSQGGFSVPTLVADRWAEIQKCFNSVRRFAEVLQDSTGGPFGWPISDGTAEVGEVVAENTSATSLDPSFATASLKTWRYSSKIFTAPIELVDDTNLDFEGYILTRGAARIGRLQNLHFTSGTGTGQPTGFAPNAAVGKTGTTGQTLTMVHADVVDLISSVNTNYRQITPQGLCFMMADTSFKVLRKLADSNLRPLYMPSDGESPESIMGYPVCINDDLAAMAANARSVAFGNFFQAYKIRDAVQVSLFRMGDAAFVTNGQLGFLMLARSGGNIVDTTGVKMYVNSAT
jgi:HK97 family phage major capsid protein